MGVADTATLPAELQVNAWTGSGAGAASPLGDDSVRWALERYGGALPKLLAPEAAADSRDWRDPTVGWGLVLPDVDGLSDTEKARGEDAPEPIRALLDARPGSPVLRYRHNRRYTQVRRYYQDRPAQDLALSASARGVREGALPRYLLIYGSPDVIPWEFQYIANQACAVGRLPVTGEPLEHYVEALIGEWAGTRSQPTHTVVWAVDHGPQDISALMRRTIAAPLQRDLAADVEIGANAIYLDGAHGKATAVTLCGALAEHRPGLVVTTSHGKTGPLADPAAMMRDLGLPVDGDFGVVSPDAVLGAWEPDGAIWYSHACCSAGCDAATIFQGLLEPGSAVDRLLEGIASLGARVAPLPEALLGAPKPLRAFIGHVEPTFDWTIKQKETGQPSRQASVAPSTTTCSSQIRSAMPSERRIRMLASSTSNATRPTAPSRRGRTQRRLHWPHSLARGTARAWSSSAIQPSCCRPCRLGPSCDERTGASGRSGVMARRTQ